SHKKTRAQWVENMNMHLGYQPTTVPQMRELDWPKEAMELADVLAELHPFENPEWRTWMKTRKEQNLRGTWKVVGFQPGMGYYDGTYTFKANPKKGEDEYLVTKSVRYADGTSLKFAGEGILYGEYHLRYALAPTALTGVIEGVFDLDVAKMGFGGKWWTVIQDNNAYGDEEFFKVDGSPRIFGLYPMALEASGKAQTLILIGLNLPKVSAADIRFADPNVKVEKVQRSYKTKIICKVVAGTNASTGASGISISGVSCDVSVTVFDKLDGIKIFPALGRARVSGGAAYPPHGVQFVARGINYGKDGKADTADDLILDPVDAEWRLEEEKTRDGDDDLKILMAPIINGLYTPLTTYGPMKERHQGREGIGLIAVSASYKGLKARALLGVTDPDYIPHIK
ncbi:MAG: hypothetical protein JSW15_06020, partial [Deltaproteobacteria bacterium]